MSVTCITDQLYLSGEIEPDDWEELRQRGITVDVNLQMERQDLLNPLSVDAYLWLPCLDGDAPSLEQLTLGVRFIHQAISLGKKVLVHCKAGIGRSVVMAVAYLVATGMNVDEALRRIQRAQPYAGPNARQLQRLYEFAALGIRLR